MAPPPIRLMLADVDGTLVTQDKVLTDRAIAAVAKLKQAGILFAITSGRPPRGMSMLIEPLGLTTPIAAFNGGVFVRPDMSVIEQRTIPDDLTPTVIEVLGGHGTDVWVYRGADWFVRDPHGPHVAREAWTVKFDPTLVESFASVTGRRGQGRGGERRLRRGPEGRGRGTRALRRPRVGGQIPAVLRRRHPSRRQQGRRGPVPLQGLPDPRRSRSPRSVTNPTTC